MQTIIKYYGNDWSDLILDSSLNLENKDLSNIILPKDRNFIQNIKDKSIEGCTMPEMDINHWDFTNINFEGCKFKLKNYNYNYNDFIYLSNKKLIEHLMKKHLNFFNLETMFLAKNL